MKKIIAAILMALALIFVTGFTASAVTPVTQVTLTAPSGTWTVPARVTEITLEMIGGGGGAAPPAGDNRGTAGGAGGNYLKLTITVTPGESFTYTNGAGGSASGGNGGDTVFETIYVSPYVRFYAVSFGGKGAVSDVGTYNTTISGHNLLRDIRDKISQSGGRGDWAGSNYGGGGGGAGGGNGWYNAGGTSAVPVTGGGNGGSGGLRDVSFSGTNGYNYGGGAGGSFRLDDRGNTGQTGAPGVIVVSYIADEIQPAEVILSGMTHTYDGTAKSATVTTDPAGLAVTVTYNGSETAPTDAGDYAVTATIDDPDYEGSATGTLTIAKKDLKVTAVTEDVDHPGTPAVTVVYDGFAPGDDEYILNDTGFVLGTTYPAGGPVGTYDTTIAIGTASDNNYNFNPLETSGFEVLDVTPPSAPVITLVPDTEWTNASAVSVTVTSGTDEDGGSGVDYFTCTVSHDGTSRTRKFIGDSIDLLPIDVEGVTNISAVTWDKAGNASDLAEKTVKIDRTKPTVTIGGIEYSDGDDIYLGYITTGFAKTVDYTKNDDASGFTPDGIRSAGGSESIPTDESGLDRTHSMTVCDRAGNEATITFSYSVISMDDLMKLLAPIRDGRTYKINSNIPVKLQITEDGVPVPMSSGDLMFALELYGPDEDIIEPSRTNKVGELGSAVFMLSPDGLTYQYNLNTKGLTKGIYMLMIYIADKAGLDEGLVGTIELELRQK